MVIFAWVGAGGHKRGEGSVLEEGLGANVAVPGPSGACHPGGVGGGASWEVTCPRCSPRDVIGLGASSEEGCVWRTHDACNPED